MPVGAGSIKRAAKAAGTAKKGQAAELLETAEKPIEEKKRGKAGKTAKKAVTEKAEKKKTAKKEAGIAQTAGKSAGQYEAYGIGQPLPVHLL